jgi:hypothetical protein
VNPISGFLAQVTNPGDEAQAKPDGLQQNSKVREAVPHCIHRVYWVDLTLGLTGMEI